MDTLPPVTLGQIIGLLSLAERLNCRLVSKRFNREVELSLTFVTNVSLNDHINIRFNSPEKRLQFLRETIYSGRGHLKIFISPLYSHKKISGLFTFLQSRCPNLGALDFYHFFTPVPLEDLLKISDRLVQIEIGRIGNIGDTTANDLKPLFPRLRSILLNYDESIVRLRSDAESEAFSLREWSYGEGGRELIVWSHVCCFSTTHKAQPALPIPPGFSIYSAPLFNKSVGPLDFLSLRQLNSPSVARSLKVLPVRMSGHTGITFDLPELLIANILSTGIESLDSLKKSLKLRILNLTYMRQVDGEALASLVSYFKYLKNLSLAVTLTFILCLCYFVVRKIGQREG